MGTAGVISKRRCCRLAPSRFPCCRMPLRQRVRSSETDAASLRQMTTTLQHCSGLADSQQTDRYWVRVAPCPRYNLSAYFSWRALNIVKHRIVPTSVASVAISTSRMRDVVLPRRSHCPPRPLGITCRIGCRSSPAASVSMPSIPAVGAAPAYSLTAPPPPPHIRCQARPPPAPIEDEVLFDLRGNARRLRHTLYLPRHRKLPHHRHTDLAPLAAVSLQQR